MSKAILIFDSYETLKKHYGKKALITISLLDDKGEATYHSTEYAILKPMPEKKHNNGGYRVIDGTEWFYDSEHDDGWNDCLDEILGEEE